MALRYREDMLLLFVNSMTCSKIVRHIWDMAIVPLFSWTCERVIFSVELLDVVHYFSSCEQCLICKLKTDALITRFFFFIFAYPSHTWSHSFPKSHGTSLMFFFFFFYKCLFFSVISFPVQVTHLLLFRK